MWLPRGARADLGRLVARHSSPNSTAGLHLLLVARSSTARALGGPEVRVQFATRNLARYSVNARRTLAPEIHPRRSRPSTRAGG
ncbi:hypothetical protein [Streptomyces roseifaciens]|uniref:hypothetical protein n=1 Tax=Streptomyces roseifaciens TaxID=1488406 RepID=UPI000718312D|nr:hypothetical protein [Streptomyces roseifaciens]